MNSNQISTNEKKLNLSNREVMMFQNRSIKTVNKEKIDRFDSRQFIKGKNVLIPIEIFNTPRSLADQKKTLMITDLGVVEDPTRTFNPCTSTGNPNGVWTFGALMRQMASPSPGSIASDLQVSDFVRNWMNTWKVNQTVNGENLPARASIQNLITNWESKSSVSPGGILNMRFAPFKLIAIVNRLDLRGNSGYGFSNAGEGRFVFNALTPTCNSQEFTVIFEYGINKKSCSAVKAFAQEWNSLNSMALGSAAYNSALENITKQFILSGTNPSKPNQNSINQIRTNEIALAFPWELREFNLNTAGQLELVNVKQEPQVKYNGSHSNAVSPVAEVEKLVSWINSNQSAILSNNYEVPLNLPSTSTTFRGGHALFPTNNTAQIWNGRGASGSQFINNDEARHLFSLNTCTSCHGGETNTIFTHIKQRSFGLETTLSGFLTGITVVDPANRPAGSPTSRSFNDLLRRENDLANLVTNNCIDRPVFELAHKLTFNPVRMTH